MAISTYTELQDAVANWLNRRDLTDRIPEFIELAESRMNRDSRLRVVGAIQRDLLTVNSQFTTLPTDFARMVNCEVVAEPVVPMTYGTPQQLDHLRRYCPTGVPSLYTIVGRELEVAPVPTESTELAVIYYRRLTALSATNDTNWLLDESPDIYLYATLLQAAPYLLHDERVAVWGGLYSQLCDEYLQSSEADQTAGSPLVMRGATLG